MMRKLPPRNEALFGASRSLRQRPLFYGASMAQRLCAIIKTDTPIVCLWRRHAIDTLGMAHPWRNIPNWSSNGPLPSSSGPRHVLASEGAAEREGAGQLDGKGEPLSTPPINSMALQPEVRQIPALGFTTFTAVTPKGAGPRPSRRRFLSSGRRFVHSLWRWKLTSRCVRCCG